MKALISKFENTLYNCNQSVGMSFVDINKIKEFQNSGNLFGLFISQYDSSINNILEKSGITADFMIQEDGTIYFKEGYQYFDYEPFEVEEVEMILSSLKGTFTAKITTPHEEIVYENKNSLDLNNIYTGIVIESCNKEEIIKQLKKYFYNIINISIREDNIWIFSKKSCLDKSVDVLCGIKNMLIQDVSMLVDYYDDSELTDSIDRLYALKDGNDISKDIYVVDSIGECLDDILNDESDSPFLSEKIV